MFALDEYAESNIPTSLIRSKADCPNIEVCVCACVYLCTYACVCMCGCVCVYMCVYAYMCNQVNYEGNLQTHTKLL